MQFESFASNIPQVVGIKTYTSAEPSGVRRELLGRLAIATGADASFWYSVSPARQVERLQVLGSTRIEERLTAYVGADPPEGAAPSASARTLQARRGSWSLAAAPASVRTSFRGMYDDFRAPDEFQMLAVHEAFYRPCGITDQLRILPFHEGAFLGWIGVVCTHGRRFDPSAGAAANALVREVEDALASARALESLGESSYVLARPCGAVEQASPRVERWLSRERKTMLRRAIRGADRGELAEARIDGVSLRFVRLDGRGGVRYLATLADESPLRLAHAASLTAVEHSVATSAVAGLSVREIADEHGLSPNTVKAHLKNVYRKLRFARRARDANAGRLT